MSNIKERILGAVTVMSEKDANSLWKIFPLGLILRKLNRIKPTLIC